MESVLSPVSTLGHSLPAEKMSRGQGLLAVEPGGALTACSTPGSWLGQ